MAGMSQVDFKVCKTEEAWVEILIIRLLACNAVQFCSELGSKYFMC